MIKGVHTMFFTSEAEALREFIRDKLDFPFVDTGEGWLIFDLPEADMGCHPTDGSPPSGTADISFYCDDIQDTVAEFCFGWFPLQRICSTGSSKLAVGRYILVLENSNDCRF